jgi:hypothetical protein
MLRPPPPTAERWEASRRDCQLPSARTRAVTSAMQVRTPRIRRDLLRCRAKGVSLFSDSSKANGANCRRLEHAMCPWVAGLAVLGEGLRFGMKAVLLEVVSIGLYAPLPEMAWGRLVRSFRSNHSSPVSLLVSRSKGATRQRSPVMARACRVEVG